MLGTLDVNIGMRGEIEMSVEAYAQQIAHHLVTIADEQEAISDIIGAAKDAGINTRVLRKVARELVMDSDKRAKLYEDENQLDLFRREVGLTTLAILEAAE
jgi:uncharacterized protein (UPF0335 family)